MNTAVTISAEDFKTIHNTLWELEYQGLNGAEGAARIRAALSEAYDQDNRAFDQKHDHYSEVREKLGLRTNWSIYGVDNMTLCHPYKDAEYVIYDNHWGDSEVVRKIEGRDWRALYRAADAAIQASGDDHHIFIESFDPIEGKPGYLRLSTGS